MYLWVWIQPDGNHIIARLMEIRDYIQQASGMLEALGSHDDSVIKYYYCISLLDVISGCKMASQIVGSFRFY